MSVGNITLDLLAKALDAVQLNHQLIANNVANVNTENYKALKLDFDAAFDNVRQLVASGADDKQIKTVFEQTDFHDSIVVDEVSARVALDQQMVELTKNSLRYQALISSRNILSGIKSAAIKGGKG